MLSRSQVLPNAIKLRTNTCFPENLFLVTIDLAIIDFDVSARLTDQRG